VPHVGVERSKQIERSCEFHPARTIASAWSILGIVATSVTSSFTIIVAPRVSFPARVRVHVNHLVNQSKPPLSARIVGDLLCAQSAY